MRLILMLLAAARLTRLVTTDWLGEWFICEPLKRWAVKHEGLVDVHEMQSFEEISTIAGSVRATENKRPSDKAWRSRLVSGLDCAHCVGFWATLGILIVHCLPLPTPIIKLRDVLIGALAGSYVVGHVSASLDT